MLQWSKEAIVVSQHGPKIIGSPVTSGSQIVNDIIFITIWLGYYLSMQVSVLCLIFGFLLKNLFLIQ